MKTWPQRGILVSLVLAPLAYFQLHGGSSAAQPELVSRANPSADDTRPSPTPVRSAKKAATRVEKIARPAKAMDAPSASEVASASTEVIPGDPLIPRVFPASLAAVPMTPWRKARLDELEPVDRKLLDFKLGVLSRMRDCDDEVLSAHGKMQVFMHFAVDPANGQASASSAELLDSTLPEELDEQALTCLRDAHMGAQLSLAGEADGDSYHFGTEITLPLDRDPAYQFFAH
jgi:hypothetical protein